MVDSPVSQLLDLITFAFRQLQILSLTQMAATALIWWDYLITLDGEVDYFWRDKLSIPKVLFFANRYLALVQQTFGAVGLIGHGSFITVPFCRFFLIAWVASLETLQTVIIQCISIFRLYAIYECNKKILWFMLALAFICDGVASAIIGIQGAQTTGTATPIPGSNFRACLISSRLNILYLYWFPFFSFELVMFGFVTFRAVKEYRALGTLRPSAWEKSNHLIGILFRDYFLFFTVLTSLYGANLGVYATGDATASGWLGSLTDAMTAIAGTRLLLNIRLGNHQNLKYTGNSIIATGNEIEFAVRGGNRHQSSSRTLTVDSESGVHGLQTIYESTNY